MFDYFDYFALNTDYGSSRTRKFSDIYPTFDSFQTAWNDTVFSQQETELSQHISEDSSNDAPQNLLLIYQLLLARYANSTIASSDENRFSLQCMATIFQYAPTWLKRLEIQETLQKMDLTSDAFLKGSSVVTNVSLNPSEDPATDTLDPLSTVNQQTVTGQKRDKFKALAILEELLRTDVTGEFLNRFRPLFRKIGSPQRPLFYLTTEENEE